MQKIKVSRAGERIDNYLSKELKITRSQIKKNISNIFVNDKNIKCGYILNENDIITYEFKEEENIKPENIKIDIIYEDDDIIIINKPNGLVVHPGAGNKNGTLVNALMYLSKDLSNINGEFRPGIVHRIDAYTTGLMVVAKNNESHAILADEIKQKKAKRKYLALVWGNIKNDSGTIDAPIGRDPNNRLKMKVTDVNSKDAVTHFKVLKRYKTATLLDVELETGRTHQIRCHMEYIGHPIVNDPVYCKKTLIDDTMQVLHAYELSLIHPKTKKYMTFKADVPESFNKILNMMEDIDGK